jgi:hypothetical protein
MISLEGRIIHCVSGGIRMEPTPLPAGNNASAVPLWVVNQVKIVRVYANYVVALATKPITKNVA